MADNGGRVRTGMRGFALPGTGRMAATLTLLALVGLASASELDGGSTLAPSVIGVIVLVLLCIAGIAMAFAKTGRGTKMVVGAVAALVLTALIAVMLMSESDPLRPTTTVKGGAAGDGGRPAGRRLDGTDGDESLALIAGGALLAALVVLVIAMVIVVRRRRAAPEAVDEEEVVLQALVESLDDLRRERDVRRAIIACYARMERALERAGSARRPAEAPFEYLLRVLERITANGPAARALTSLFERAKFSVEPMGEREKQQAIGALELLRAEVSGSL